MSTVKVNIYKECDMVETTTSGPDCYTCGCPLSKHQAYLKQEIDIEKQSISTELEIGVCYNCWSCDAYSYGN